jgi:ketosteroid isomerase-like protein
MKQLHEVQDGSFVVENRTKMFVFDAKVFAHVTVALEKSQIFELDSPVQVCSGTMEVDNLQLYSLRSGMPMNSDLLKFPILASQRRDEYALKISTDLKTSPSRATADEIIPFVLQTPRHLKDLRTKIEQRVCSIDKNEIEVSGTKQELLDELDRLRDFIDDIPHLPNRLTKKMIASTLCKYRREAFSASPSLKNELLVESLKDVPSTASTVEDRKEVVQHSFLAFVEAAKSERFKKTVLLHEKYI